MKQLILLATAIPILVTIVNSNPAFAYDDPKHCNGYNACFSIGYNDGYSDAQDGVSPAYACVAHTHSWCDGYNNGFRAGNGGSNIYYGPTTGQTASIDVHGNNNKISVNQQTNNRIGYNAGSSSNHKESSGTGLPNCAVLCLNSNINIK